MGGRQGRDVEVVSLLATTLGQDYQYLFYKLAADILLINSISYESNDRIFETGGGASRAAVRAE